MRYILDSNGYIEAIAFGSAIICNNNSCTEYIGTIPDGYSSLAEWAENANIRAYKIVSNNLTYDSVRDAELQEQWEMEEDTPDGNVSEYSYYIVTTENTTTIPLTQYSDGNIVDVYINGFKLIKGLHFSISENNIVLANAVDTVGTEIEIVIKKYN